MHRKVSHLTEIIMVAVTMIVGKINSNNYSNNNNYGGNNNLEIIEIIAVIVWETLIIIMKITIMEVGYNRSANSFDGGTNDFPSLDNFNNNNNSYGSNNNGPSNPFGNNNGPSNPFGNNSDPSNPLVNNSNHSNPS